MTMERTNHERAKLDLNIELENVLKAAGTLAATFTSQEVLPSEITQNLCNVVEAIFIHGLRDPFFLKGSRYAKYPEPNFWPFVSKYSHKSIINQINGLNQIKSEIGKGRAWIRIVLNERSLEHYLQLLLSEHKAMSQFYNEWAFLRDHEQVDRMTGFVKSLTGIPINAAINSSFLNYWTPSPLILAGLMSGKPIKVEPIHRKSSGPSLEPIEAGVSALDYLPTSVKILSPIRTNKNVIMTVGSVSDDDASSVYSHPSMLDRHDRHHISSTPKESTFVAASTSSLFVARRTKRPRRGSRSRSASNSQGTSELTPRSVLESEMPQSLPNDSFAESLATLPDITQVFKTSADVKKVTSVPEIDYTMEQEQEEKIKEEVKEEEKMVETPAEVISLPYEKPPSTAPIEISEKINEVLPFQEDNFEKEEEKDVFEDIESCGLPISSDHNNDDSLLGTSLHDELMSALSFETPSSGNKLSAAGAWAVSRGSMDNGDGDTSGILSSSSGSSGIPVSFDQALRSAMEQHSPDEEMSFADTEEESEESGQSSQQMDINHRLITIPKEIGLVAQDFRCPMCRKSVGSVFSFAKYDVCGVDGMYYCMDCMKPGGVYTIPSRVLHSWDWEQRNVSDRGRAFIEANLERPIFNIEVLNPNLYKHVPSLNVIYKLRERLQIVSLYLFNCRESIADDFKKRIHPRDYLYSDVHVYSFMDLQNVRAGNLEKQLTGWLKYSIAHVMGCVLCKQKGFICEICNKQEVIYPFNTQSTYRCGECFSVYHNDCAINQACPKCARRAHYEVKASADVLPLD